MKVKQKKNKRTGNFKIREGNLSFAMKGDKNMDYKTMRNQIEDMVNDNHKDFVKVIISMEKGINDGKLYDAYMDNDSLNLLH